MDDVSSSLHRRLDRALSLGGGALDDLAAARPLDHRDGVLTLLTVHDLHVAPIRELGERVRWQHHPAVAALKTRLEDDVLARLGRDAEPVEDAVAEVRAIAAEDLVPPVYEWAAEDASWRDLLDFLALEGGPDGGFDDLVAACQIGIDGEPKLELARNYWDEMGRGDLAEVHTELHRGLVRSTGMEAVPRTEQPLAALDRAVLGSLLATNRWLQPEMVGALGLIELQAGPRCRRVVKGLERLGASEDALAFYAEHQQADPRHGKDWLDHVIGPLSSDPEWAARMVRGARWRAAVNRAFLEDAEARFVVDAAATEPEDVAAA